MLWLKAFHIIFMVAWFAGLFYLPRLFVYHAEAADSVSLDRFCVMEKKLFYFIMTPGAILTLIFGISMLILNPAWLYLPWMQIKLALVVFLIFYHIYLGKLVADFKQHQNKHSSVFYRWLNEIPTIFLITIIILVVVKPMFSFS